MSSGEASEGERPGDGGHSNKAGHQSSNKEGKSGDGGHGNKEIGEPPYVINHRNPLHCGAESTCLWELERVRLLFVLPSNHVTHYRLGVCVSPMCLV